MVVICKSSTALTPATGSNKKARAIIALAKNAVSLIIAHNHVSGNPKPSADDVKITCRLKDSCDLMGISLLDHIIIGGDRHYSFAKEGLM